MQTIVLTGRVMRSPEMKYLDSGTAVTTFTVAVPYGYKKQDEQYRPTMWARITAWRKLGEICNQYLEEGSTVYVTGELTPDRESGNPKVFNRNDGTAGASFEVRADKVEFGRRTDGDFQPTATPEAVATTVDNTDDIPF